MRDNTIRTPLHLTSQQEAAYQTAKHQLFSCIGDADPWLNHAAMLAVIGPEAFVEWYGSKNTLAACEAILKGAGFGARQMTHRVQMVDQELAAAARPLIVLIVKNNHGDGQ